MTRSEVRKGDRLDSRVRHVAAAILGAFVLAGITGSLYRFGLAYGWTAGFNLINVRHAHSHLMYMGWATPALFLLVGWRMTSPGDTVSLRRVVVASVLLALAAYVPFLLYGYGSADLRGVRLPLSVILSGVNLLAWYAFVAWYARRSTAARIRSPGKPLWDLAAVLLVIATLGAWGLSLLKPFGIEDPVWSETLKHLFLDVVSDGWMVVAVLGLALHDLSARSTDRSHWSMVFIGIGVPLSFLVGMPDHLVPTGIRLAGGAGSAIAVVGLGYHWLSAWKAGAARQSPWLVPLGFLAFKLAAQLIVAVLPGVSWAEMHGLRVLYLHVMLLGFVTTGVVAGLLATAQLEDRIVWLTLVVSILLVIISLAALVIPALSVESVVWRAAAWISLAPTGVAAWMAVRLTVRTSPASGADPGGS